MRNIDLNSDVGESFGAYTMGNDEEMMKVISSANVACGFHAGDPLVMHKTLTLAKRAGVAVGAHPSLIDLWGFGRRWIQDERPADVEKILVYQLAAIKGMAQVLDVTVTHFKPHGSLGNMSAIDADLADACIRAVKVIDPNMIVVTIPGSELERAACRLDLRIAREAYADRAYDSCGKLVSRKCKGAVIHDPDVAVPRILRMVEEQEIVSIDGKRIPMTVDSICVHGDNPAAVAMASRIRTALIAAGIAIEPMSEIVA